MRQVVFVLLFVFAFYGSVFSQEWKVSAILSLNLTQNVYSDNWTGGEIGAISWISFANIIAEKQLSEKYHWRNVGKFGFGQTHKQNAETNNWETPEKSTDKIDIESVLKMTLKAVIDPYVAFRFESQFLDNSEPRLKRTFNPMLLTGSAGASRTIYRKDKNEVVSRFGFAVREHIDRTVVSVNPDQTYTETAIDGGLELVTDVRCIISPERLSYEGKLTVFKALFYSKSDDEEEDYWKSPDVNWENIITASITKYIQVTLYIQLLYDKEIDKGGRFKETLAMGLTYKVF